MCNIVCRRLSMHLSIFVEDAIKSDSTDKYKTWEMKNSRNGFTETSNEFQHIPRLVKIKPGLGYQ